MNTKNSKQHGILINKSGHKRYTKPDAISKLIKYISRENNDTRNDLVGQGALGTIDFAGADTVIQQFQYAQLQHTRKGNFGRYIDHEIYSFSEDEIQSLTEKHISLENIAQNLAKDFYADGYQVYYGIHNPDKDEKHTHIHFAINTVNYHTGNKRREPPKETEQRRKRLQQIIEDTITQSEIDK